MYRSEGPGTENASQIAATINTGSWQQIVWSENSVGNVQPARLIGGVQFFDGVLPSNRQGPSKADKLNAHQTGKDIKDNPKNSDRFHL